MGLFGGRKIIVSSVAYNLLGDERPVNWVATTLSAAAIAGAPSLGEYFKDALFTDASMRIRNFIRWTNGSSEYKNKFGIYSSSFYADYETSAEAFQPLVPEEIRSFESSIGEFDPGYYAEWWIQENHPELALKDYTVEEVYSTDYLNNSYVHLVITFESEDKVYSFDETSMDLSGLWLYIKYTTDTSAGLIYYKEKSGHPEYDSLFGSRTRLEGTYCPPIPFRIDNKFLSEYEDQTLYHLAKRAFTKAVGQNKYNSFEKQIEDNDSIGDIDFAYLVLGVNLNTKTQVGREYLFTFFQNLYENQPANRRETSFSIGSDNDVANLNYTVVLEWKDSDHTYKTGKCIEDAEPGKYYVTTSQDTITVLVDQSGEGDAEPREEEQVVAEHTLFCHQLTESQYEVYDYKDLKHCTTVYKGRVTSITGSEALKEEDPSGFIVPIELETWKEFGLVKGNNLAQEVYQLVFNCYTSKKVRWYQSGMFRFIVTVILVVIAYYCPPAAFVLKAAAALSISANVLNALIAAGLMILAEIAGRIGGWFGKFIQVLLIAYAVYTAATSIYQSFAVATQTAGQGLTVTTTPALTESGIIIGSSVNAGLAVPMAGGIAASGSGFGLALTESAANTFAQTVGTSITATGAATIDIAPSAAWGFLSTAKNLLEISKPVVKGMQLYYKFAVEDYQQTLNHLQGQANELNKQIQEASKIFNSNSIVDVGTILSTNYFSMESRDAFLQRTSMVGSDIVELSLAMIHNFADMTLSTELS